ncbi:PAS domain S-box protein [Chloracidobacterium thermophilum]|uniref:PAS domain S-box protein n=1 Tax=Chloracidobacterium thermophilum TaxID=458033 RepID=UPI00073894D7|nr:PAS domain S-box protein [Chloracidobacterium thermophilum]
MREILEPIAHQLQNPPDLDRVLSAVVQRAAESVTAVCARLWLIRRGDVCQTCRWAEDCPDKRRCLHLKANFGIPVEAAYRRAPLIVLSGEQLARGGVVAWTPPPSAAAMLLDPRLADEQGVMSFIAHPLRVENRVLGLLAVFGARMFTAADFETCATQAAAASTAIRVAELVNRVQRADTTARDKSRELEQQSRLLTAILTHSTDRALLIEDLDGNILAFNEGARRAYGYGPEEVIGRATADKLHAPEDWRSGHVTKIYQQALEQGVYVGEIRRQHQDGHIFVEHTTLTTLRDEEGDPAGFLSLAPVGAGPARSAASEAVLVALEELATIRRPENIAAETLSQMCRLSAARAAALLTLEGSTLSVRAVHGEAAFVSGLAGRKWSLGDVPELFRALEQGQAEPLGASAGRLLTDAAAGGLVIPMLRQQVQAVAVLVAPQRTDTGPLLQLAKLAASFLKWQLLAEQIEVREHALVTEEAARRAELEQLEQAYEQLAAAHQSALAKVTALETQVQHLLESVQVAADAQQAAEAQMAELASRLATAEAEQARLMEVCRQSEVLVEQSRQATAEALARCEILAAGQETALRERDLFRSRVELLEADLRQTRQRAERSTHQHAEALVHLHELEAALAARTQALETAEQALVELQERYEASYHQMAARVAQLEDLLGEAQQALSAHDAEAERLAAQVRELTDEVAAAHQARLDAQHAIEALRHDLDTTQQLLEEAVVRGQTAERTAAEIEERAATLLSEVIAVQEEQARLIKECEALEDALSTARAEADRQAQAVALFEVHIDALERSLATSEVSRAALVQQVETLLAERSVWRQTLDHLEARLAERQARAQAAVSASPVTGESTSAALPLAEAEVARLRETLAQREAENASLRQRLSLLQGTYRETVAVLQSRLDDLTKLNAITGAHRKLEDMLFEAAPPASTAPVVVVACDDADLGAQLAAWCQQSGYQTRQVMDSDATLATLMLDPPQSIVLAGSPAHIGDAYRRIRRNPDWRTLPIVVITPEAFAGISASPSTLTLDRQAISPASLQKALRQWSVSGRWRKAPPASGEAG